MKSLLEKLKPFKIAFIVLGGAFLFYVLVGIVIPIILNATANKTPIVSVVAKNDKVYSKEDTIKKSNFTVKAIHKSGKKSKISEKQFNISRKKISAVGSYTDVTISLKDNPDIKCTVKVKNEREKIVGFQCGYPDAKKVVAVLYSNGELCFEGEGDTIVFDESDFPWQHYDEKKSYPIEAVTFQEKVQPTNMDHWFKKNTTLTYVDSIPKSVKTMVGTFKSCTELKKMADMSQCSELLNISNAYENCDNLFYTCPIPASVTTAVSTFEGCSELQDTPDMTNATGLINAEDMFYKCKKLTGVKMAPNIQNLRGTFKDCINLKDMPVIPTSAECMDSTFDGDVSLTNLTNIPKKVTNIETCFKGCELASGDLKINCNAEDYSGVFNNAAVATTVNLIGKSKNLDYYANETDSRNIFVRGSKPKEVNKYDNTEEW